MTFSQTFTADIFTRLEVQLEVSGGSCGASDTGEPRVSQVGEIDDLDVDGDEDDDDDGSESGGSNDGEQADILDQEDINQVKKGLFDWLKFEPIGDRAAVFR